jgi:hypothetical protein
VVRSLALGLRDLRLEKLPHHAEGCFFGGFDCDSAPFGSDAARSCCRSLSVRESVVAASRDGGLPFSSLCEYILARVWVGVVSHQQHYFLQQWPSLPQQPFLQQRPDYANVSWREFGLVWSHISSIIFFSSGLRFRSSLFSSSVLFIWSFLLATACCYQLQCYGVRCVRSLRRSAQSCSQVLCCQVACSSLVARFECCSCCHVSCSCVA